MTGDGTIAEASEIAPPPPPAAAAGSDPGSGSGSGSGTSGSQSSVVAVAVVAGQGGMKVLNFDANQATGVIRYDGVLVWGDAARNELLEALPGGYLTHDPRDLIAEAKKKKKKEGKGGGRDNNNDGGGDDDDDRCRLIPQKLAQVVGSASALGGGSPGAVAAWAKFVAGLTNLDRPAAVEKGDKGLSEMFFQQLVFSPVAGLYYCFHHEGYVANELASSGYGCATLTTTGRKGGAGAGAVTHRNVPFVCRPDAACLASAKDFVLATMELKNNSGKLDGDDMFNCVLMTSITAVAMVREERVADEVFVPFVVNVGERATLFVATMDKDRKAPAVLELSRARLSRRGERVRFVALLACLLHKLAELVGSTPAGTLLTRFLERVPSRTSTSSRSGTIGGSSGGGELDDASPPVGRDRSSTSAGDRDRPGSVMAALGAASIVASCDGRVADLVPFSGRYADSPFYFLGARAHSLATAAAADALPLPVFVKVWREGDERTSLKSVQLEMELLDRAHQAEVPCPAVVPAFTELSIPLGVDVFHRLVMHRVANCAVERSDLGAYALSLVKAVLRLHAAGILHCDIKPANVAWDATTKTARLLDFGLSRREEEEAAAAAGAYAGTKGYTAPEVERRLEPHSRRSDAYSVGRTILTAGQSEAREGTSATCYGEVMDAAHLLSRDVSDGRISLEDALERLERSSSKGEAFA